MTRNSFSKLPCDAMPGASLYRQLCLRRPASNHVEIFYIFCTWNNLTLPSNFKSGRDSLQSHLDCKLKQDLEVLAFRETIL